MAINIWSSVIQKKQTELSDALKSAAIHKKNPELETIFKLDNVSELQNFQSFEESLERLCTKYSAKGLSKFVTKKLYPHLDTIRTFTDGISAATQSQGNASLCWGCLLIVIQCGCIFTESLEEIIDLLEVLQNELPACQEYVDLYHESPGLRFALEDIFIDYVDYCILIVKHLGRSPVVNLLRTLISSSFKREMKGMRSKIANHVQVFNAKATAEHRHRAEAYAKQTQAFLTNLTTKPQSQPTSGPIFPLDTITLRRNQDFTGREDELNSLKKHLSAGNQGTEPISAIIHGIGGYGKTHTALEFTYRNKSSYDAVFWVEAEYNFTLLKSFGRIGRALKLFDVEDVNQPEIERIMTWLQTTDKRWLIVFDNVGAYSSISQYWPTSCRGVASIIVTAQKSGGTKTFGGWADYEVPLAPLDDVAGSHLLLHQLGLSDIADDDPNVKLAKETCRLLGGSPLWLNQAGGLIRLQNSSLAEYVETYRHSSRILGEKNEGGNWRYERLALATFDRTLDELSSDALNFLFMLAFMNPDYIEEDILLTEHKFGDIAFLDPKHKARYLSMVGELASGQLVLRQKINQETAASMGDAQVFLRIHRSVQEGLLQKLNNKIDVRETAFARVVSLLREEYPLGSKVQQAEPLNWPLTQKLLPHILSLSLAFDRSDPPISGSLKFAELLSDVGGMNMYDRGFIEDAQKLLEMALGVLDKMNHPLESVLRGNIFTVLGLLSDTIGISKRAEGHIMREKNVIVRENCHKNIPQAEVTVDDEILLFNAQTDLACSLQHLNRFDEVVSTCEKCLKQYRSWGSEEEYPYEYAKYYHHIAYVLLYEGKTDDAAKQSKHGSDLMALAKPGSQLAVTFRFEWATILFQVGKTADALREHHEMLQLRIDGCGENNLLTLQSRLHIGIMYYHIKEFSKAE